MTASVPKEDDAGVDGTVVVSRVEQVGGPDRQYAALPYRTNSAGGLEVLLMTSRDTGRWVIPKGWPKPKLSPIETAAREAKEEAGIEGRLSKQPIGAYAYDKRWPIGTTRYTVVHVFAMEVQRQRAKWREMDERLIRWLPVDEAATVVDEPELAELIRNLDARLETS